MKRRTKGKKKSTKGHEGRRRGRKNHEGHEGGKDIHPKFTILEPFAKFGSALGQPWVSPWERGRPARILVKALPRRQSAGEPTNPVKPIATTLPSLVRAGRPRSQGSQPFPAINPTYWRILQKAHLTHLSMSFRLKRSSQCSVSEIGLPYFGAQRRRIQGATTRQCSFIVRRSDAEDGAVAPEPLGPMEVPGRGSTTVPVG